MKLFYKKIGSDFSLNTLEQWLLTIIKQDFQHLLQQL